MDRKQLKEILSKIDAGDTVTVEYGVRGTRSETYTVKERKVWRGKGGSILLECQDSSGNAVKVGSFQADSIVNVAVNGGETFGLPTNTQLVPVLKTDKQKSIALKTQFLSFADQISSKNGLTVSVEASTEPNIEGTFKVTKVRTTAGRGGPVVLDLVDLSNGKGSVLSAVRHSGVIDKIIIVSGATETETD